MKIHPFTFTCPRDFGLAQLCMDSLNRFKVTQPWTVFHDPAETLPNAPDVPDAHDGGRIWELRPRVIGFFPQDGWPCALSKLDGWRQMAEGKDQGDWILYVDSDGYFHTPAVLAEMEEGWDFLGFGGDDARYSSRFQAHWVWLSGCMQAATVGGVRRLLDQDLEEAKAELVADGFSLMEDVVVSYLAERAGLRVHRLSQMGGHWEAYPQLAILDMKPPRSFSHLNGDYTSFLGLPVAGKFDIPAAITKAGLWPEVG